MSAHELKWWDQGACKGLDASVFYPDDDDDASVAEAVCEGCPVKIACLEHALAVRERVGVWGGTTERDRRRIRRQRRRSA